MIFLVSGWTNRISYNSHGDTWGHMVTQHFQFIIQLDLFAPKLSQCKPSVFGADKAARGAMTRLVFSLSRLSRLEKGRGDR